MPGLPQDTSTYLLVVVPPAGGLVPPEVSVFCSHPTNAKQATNANSATNLIVFLFVCSFCLPPAQAGWRWGNNLQNSLSLPSPIFDSICLWFRQLSIGFLRGAPQRTRNQPPAGSARTAQEQSCTQLYTRAHR